MKKNSDARSWPRPAQERVRLLAVQAVVEHGKKQYEAAELFGVSKDSVCRWVKAYGEKGEEGLLTKKIGRPKGGVLGCEHKDIIMKAVLEALPGDFGLYGAFWSRELVAQFVKLIFRIDISRCTVGRQMKSWGMTAQKPATRAIEQDPEKVAKWLNEEYPALRERAEKEDAIVMWLDETGVKSSHQSGVTWGMKGQTPIVSSTTKRFSCNMIASMTNKGQLIYKVFVGKFNQDVYINFLSRLLKHGSKQLKRDGKPKKIILIADRHTVHTGKKVRNWVNNRSEQIELAFLPPSSPELNPVELLNRSLKSNVFRRARPSDINESMSLVRSFMRRMQNRTDNVIKFFNGKLVQYANLKNGDGIMPEQAELFHRRR